MTSIPLTISIRSVTPASVSSSPDFSAARTAAGAGVVTIRALCAAEAHRRTEQSAPPGLCSHPHGVGKSLHRFGDILSRLVSHPPHLTARGSHGHAHSGASRHAHGHAQKKLSISASVHRFFTSFPAPKRLVWRALLFFPVSGKNALLNPVDSAII